MYPVLSSTKDNINISPLVQNIRTTLQTQLPAFTHIDLPRSHSSSFKGNRLLQKTFKIWVKIYTPVNSTSGASNFNKETQMNSSIKFNFSPQAQKIFKRNRLLQKTFKLWVKIYTPINSTSGASNLNNKHK